MLLENNIVGLKSKSNEIANEILFNLNFILLQRYRHNERICG